MLRRLGIATLVGVWVLWVCGGHALAADGPFDAALVKLLAEQEIRAGRLTVRSDTCLAFVPERNPSDRLLA